LTTAPRCAKSSRSLFAARYQRDYCADAASALAQFEQNRPDVVITDVIMPDQDGYSVCSQIKQNPEFTRNAGRVDVRRG